MKKKLIIIGGPTGVGKTNISSIRGERKNHG